MTLHEVLAALYRSEINASISSFWDAGWTVRLGDEMNGWKAEMSLSPLDHEDVLEAAAGWLDRQARWHYPDSDYAKGTT